MLFEGQYPGEKKSKTSCGAQTVDYEKTGTAAVQRMTAADVHRFLVVCALVSDLYCPGYGPRESLAKDSSLPRTAARYPVNSAKIAGVVRMELSQKKGPQTRDRKSVNATGERHRLTTRIEK